MGQRFEDRSGGGLAACYPEVRELTSGSRGEVGAVRTRGLRIDVVGALRAVARKFVAMANGDLWPGAGLV